MSSLALREDRSGGLTLVHGQPRLGDPATHPPSTQDPGRGPWNPKTQLTGERSGHSQGRNSSHRT